MLQIKGISKQYRTGELIQRALDDVSFCLRDNEFVSILGPSGSGKTTLLNIIGGLDRYDSGDLVINGVSTKEYKNKDWDTYRNHTIGFVFQSYNLIPHQNILSNVELALTIGGVSVRERKKRAKAALEEVGLGEHIHKKPNQLSGGQMQRVAIARALVNDPDILLADEPTGALDSETSVQIMDLLKKVAEHRLVVMVTHNAELAEEYSTRIIRLKDGKIISDTNPVQISSDGKIIDDSAKAAKETERTVKSKNNARMSFMTCLALSANNLRSKKGRTILISLACSIGIIGIALILSVSTGVNNYILNIQKETMSSYPITISSQTVDLSGLMSESTSMRRNVRNMLQSGAADDNAVHTDFSTLEASELFTTSFVKNNLTDFKQYLDDPDNGINNYLGENGIVYSYNVNFDVYTDSPEGKLLNTDADINDISTSGTSFSLMSAGLSRMRTNMFSGRSRNRGGASNFSEITPGKDGQAISQIVKDNYDVISGRWPEEYDEVILVLSSLHTLPAETLYQLGIMSADEYLEAAECIENGNDPEPLSWNFDDVCGKSFYLVTESDYYLKNSDGTFSYMDDSVIFQNAIMDRALELKIVGVAVPAEEAAVMNLRSAVAYTSKLTDYCIQHTEASEVITAQKENPDTNVLTGLKFTVVTEEEKAQEVIDYVSSMSAAEKSQLYTLAGMYYTPGTTDIADLLSGESGSEISALAESAGSSTAVSNEAAESAGTSTGAAQEEAESPAADTAGDSAADAAAAESAGDSAADAAMAESAGDSAADAAMAESAGASNEGAAQAAQSAPVVNAMTEEEMQAAMVDQWLNNDPDKALLASLYDEFILNGSYDENMSSFGMVSYDAPVSISIYTDTFEDKDNVTACIDSYNKNAEDGNEIVYTDYIALITSSVTQMVDAISYVLIAFVAISLIVSSIMIGIITHISVLERTKEIGILRAMGASKRNISYVFNAETVIIGLISGIIGIVISLLLSIPINMILKALLDSSMISVSLPVLYAILLIIISIIVTLIGGLIPAAKAAKKDPVIALRTE